MSATIKKALLLNNRAIYNYNVSSYGKYIPHCGIRYPNLYSINKCHAC